jgi:hypothetical protein
MKHIQQAVLRRINNAYFPSVEIRHYYCCKINETRSMPNFVEIDQIFHKVIDQNAWQSFKLKYLQKKKSKIEVLLLEQRVTTRQRIRRKKIEE